VFGSFESHYFTFESLGNVVVARCILSNLSEEENIEPVGQELLTLVGKYECRRLILDLVDVEYMTSSMVGILIRVHRQMHRDNGKLVLCHLNHTVDDILRTSHLLTYFNVAPTLDEAADQFEDFQSDQDTVDLDEEDFGENTDTV
jgi:anti-sigma B factor antagonist